MGESGDPGNEKSGGRRAIQYAAYRLGKLYLQGEQVPKDVPRAVEYLSSSRPELGNQYAQYTLGKLYLAGEDVAQDREQAYSWFRQAAAAGKRVRPVPPGPLRTTTAPPQRYSSGCHQSCSTTWARSFGTTPCRRRPAAADAERTAGARQETPGRSRSLMGHRAGRP